MGSVELVSTSIGGRIRELRKTHKPKPLTQKDLVARIKKKGGTITESTLSLIENGNQVPRDNTINMIAAALRVAPEKIKGDTQYDKQPPSSLAEIHEVLDRFRPLRQNEFAIDRVIEQIRIWSVAVGAAGSEPLLRELMKETAEAK